MYCSSTGQAASRDDPLVDWGLVQVTSQASLSETFLIFDEEM